jgi:hypothetical protein
MIPELLNTIYAATNTVPSRQRTRIRNNETMMKFWTSRK